MRMMNDPFFVSKKILVIDAATKNTNDRTWCFWETQPDLFEPIVHHQWKQLDFFSNYFSGSLGIDPYVYKMIQGIDFYQYIMNTAAQHPNVEFVQARVRSINNNSEKAGAELVLEDGTILTASKIFNSILFTPIKVASNQFYFQQHFKGWLIKTEEACFDSSKATFMDFCVSQEHGTTFMYMLPVANNKALLEYTLFTEELINQSEYDIALKKYIKEHLKIDDYTIEHEEFGIIPMTNVQFPRENGNIVYIGIAGGQAKASSGYAFKFIQKRTAAIVSALKNGTSFSATSFKNVKGHLYDSTLLRVLHERSMNGDEIFAQIFKKIKAADVLAFLDNESSFFTDLRIMNSVPIKVFLPAALKELFAYWKYRNEK
ncbi:MAG: lycopene cyclase [Sphingobacteriia bacterium]|nr:MAG: lycopene cyclase [Sphingobacteriia bacterium]